jgi:hypothetical protein
VQVLDVSINKLVKKFIEEEEQIYYDNNLDTFAAETVNIGQRRILMTWWVATAWKRVYDEYQDLIVKTFKHVGLSLNPNGFEDYELKIKDLPSIAVGDWRASADNPEITLRDEANELIEAEDDRYLYTAEEVANGIPDIQLGEEYITTDTDTNTDFDPDSDSDADSYDDDINRDAEDADMNM